MSDSNNKKKLLKAKRAAFLARLIVLREGKKCKAHREIEQLEWDSLTTAEDLANKIASVFKRNTTSILSIQKDLKRALAHSDNSAKYFANEYEKRSTTNFIDALKDYERSNELLFGDNSPPKFGGWCLPDQLEKEKKE